MHLQPAKALQQIRSLAQGHCHTSCAHEHPRAFGGASTSLPTSPLSESQGTPTPAIVHMQPNPLGCDWVDRCARSHILSYHIISCPLLPGPLFQDVYAASKRGHHLPSACCAASSTSSTGGNSPKVCSAAARVGRCTAPHLRLSMVGPAHRAAGGVGHLCDKLQERTKARRDQLVVRKRTAARRARAGG